MIYNGTSLSISDNSGAKKTQCIKVYRYKKKFGIEGSIICNSVKALRSSKRINMRVKKGEVVSALIITTKIFRFYTKVSSHAVAFKKNSVLLVNKQHKLIGTRILNPFSIFFRQTRYLKLTFLGPGLIK